ncbi:HNH endonuclease [bacterium]|nr:HNH endonuclease [bacterium]
MPKSRKGREVVDICVHCHKQIHALFAEKELERHYNTIEALLETEAMRRWVEWVTQRKPRSRVFTKKSRRIR